MKRVYLLPIFFAFIFACSHSTDSEKQQTEVSPQEKDKETKDTPADKNKPSNKKPLTIKAFMDAPHQKLLKKAYDFKCEQKVQPGMMNPEVKDTVESCTYKDAKLKIINGEMTSFNPNNSGIALMEVIKKGISKNDFKNLFSDFNARKSAEKDGTVAEKGNTITIAYTPQHVRKWTFVFENQTLEHISYTYMPF